MVVGSTSHTTVVHDTKTVTVTSPGPTVTVTKTITVTAVPQSCLDMVRIQGEVQADVDTLANASQHERDYASQAYVAIVAHDTQKLNAATQAMHDLENSIATAREHLYDTKPVLDGATKRCQNETKK